MKLGGMQKSSTIDFPGHLSCVLFTVGCNLDCFYCHNRALLQSDAPLLMEDEVIAFLSKRAGLLDGVVISGGEPTLQGDLGDFMREVRALGYHIKLDTNGQMPSVVAQLLSEGLVDYLAVDVKASKEEYALVTGKAGFESALETLEIAMKSGVPCEGRTTVYPGCREQGLFAIAQAMPPLPRWRLNVYRVPALYKEQDALRVRIPALSEGELSRLLPALREFQPNIVL